MDESTVSDTSISIRESSLSCSPPFSYKWNAALLVHLRDIDSDRQFAVATYHMPAAWRDTTLMMIHAALSVKLAQQAAG